MGEKHKGLANAASILYSVLNEIVSQPCIHTGSDLFSSHHFHHSMLVTCGPSYLFLTPGCQDFIESTRLEDIHTSTQAECI